MKSTLESVTGFKQPDNMSRQQYNYAVAKAAYDIADENMKKDTYALDLAQVKDLTDEQFEGFCKQCEVIEERWRTRQYKAILRSAEEELIDWAMEAARKQYGEERFKQVEPAYTLGRKANNIHRAKLIELCFATPFEHQEANC